MKRRLRDLTVRELRGRRALVRVDYNVPLDGNGSIRDDTRIRATLPTLRHLLNGGAVPVLLSHLGRPGGEPREELSLAPVAERLESLLGRPVDFVGSPETDDAVERTLEAGRGTVLLAENVRFLPGETVNEPALGERLARLGDLFVNDAFGASHRAHASTVGVASHLRPAVAGFLVERELEALGALREEVQDPFVVAFGGAKIADKIGLFEGLARRAGVVLVGGAMANTFLRAGGAATGRSLVEEGALKAAGGLLERLGNRLELPTDLVVAPSPEEAGRRRVVGSDAVPEDAMALDIGPATRERFGRHVEKAATFFWNGPMGLFETEAFAEGTRALVAAAIRATARGAFTVVGGGDSARAVHEAGASERISHVSTGGGAALRFLEEGSLPAIDILEDA